MTSYYFLSKNNSLAEDQLLRNRPGLFDQDRIFGDILINDEL